MASPGEEEEGKRLFMEKVEHELGKQGATGIIFREPLYNQIVETLDGWQDITPAERGARNAHVGGNKPQRWCKRFKVRTETAGDGTVRKLLLRQPGSKKRKRDEGEGGDGCVPLDAWLQVLHVGNVWEQLKSQHCGAGQHLSGKRTWAAVSAKFDRVPRWMALLAATCCSICSHRPAKKKTKAGHTPLITRGFAARGQVDLIDFQANPDGEFKWLLNYVDHGIKLYDNRPLCNKSAAAVAAALVDIFTFIGPPKLLQADNGKEFSRCALGSRNVRLTDDEVCQYPYLRTNTCIGAPIRVLVHQYADLRTNTCIGAPIPICVLAR